MLFKHGAELSSPRMVARSQDFGLTNIASSRMPSMSHWLHHGEYRESDLFKMFTFMKMVVTRVKNWSPDMIPVAFERKFDE